MADKRKSSVSRYFLGANSRYGFYSLYDDFVNLKSGDFLWVIKGGPGCGKSTFMKKLGAALENAGAPVEYIHCSGDPDSLDGVWFPSLRTGYVDGTAPHVIEAVYPGSASLYLDLGTFYDAEALEKDLSAVVELNSRYKDLYARAYDYLAASAVSGTGNFGELRSAAAVEKTRRKLYAAAAREFKGPGGGGSVRRRFLSAVSCKGRITLTETLKAGYERLWQLDSELGLAPVFLETCAQFLDENNYGYILCPDPLDPRLPEALLIPERSLAIVSFTSVDIPEENTRTFRLDELTDSDLLKKLRPKLRQAKKTSEELLSMGIETLAEAKKLHDELESVYNPHVDFDSVDAVARHHAEYLLKELG